MAVGQVGTDLVAQRVTPRHRRGRLIGPIALITGRGRAQRLHAAVAGAGGRLGGVEGAARRIHDRHAERAAHGQLAALRGQRARAGVVRRVDDDGLRADVDVAGLAVGAGVQRQHVAGSLRAQPGRRALLRHIDRSRTCAPVRQHVHVARRRDGQLVLRCDVTADHGEVVARGEGGVLARGEAAADGSGPLPEPMNCTSRRCQPRPKILTILTPEDRVQPKQVDPSSYLKFFEFQFFLFLEIQGNLPLEL